MIQKTSKAALAVSNETIAFLENVPVFKDLCCVDADGFSTGNCVVSVASACKIEGVCGDESCGHPTVHAVDLTTFLDGILTYLK